MRTSWRQEQKLKKRRRFLSLTKPVFFFLALVFFGLVGLLLVREVRSSPLGEGRTTLVLATEPVLVFSFEEGQLLLLAIPERTYVQVSRGFGSYRFGAVWGLGELEKKTGGGGKLLSETTQDFLGVAIDGWAGPKNGKWQITNGEVSKEKIVNLKTNLTSWAVLTRGQDLLKFWQNLKTNLTIFDLVRVWLLAKNTRFDKVQVLPLGQTPALTELILADGTKALTAEAALLDAAYKGLLKESRLLNEHILVEVLNGTEKSGLGQKVSRIVGNGGGEVIALGNSPTQVRQCQLKTEKEFLSTFTVRWLARVFACQILAEKPPDSRADIQLTIGEDFWQRLYQR